MDKDLEYPTVFTVRQLEALHESLRAKNSKAQGSGSVAPADHNLERKLLEYCTTARRVQHHRARG